MLERPPELDREHYYEGTTVSDRSLKEYERDLGIDFKNMEGQLVLDLGSGKTQKFAKEASRYNVDVVSLNPEFQYSDARKLGRPSIIDKIKFRNWKSMPVAAIAQELPFKDNSFDRVFGSWSILQHLDRKKSEFLSSFQESLRVLKEEGEMIFYPLSRILKKSTMFQEVLEDLQNNSDISCRISQVGTEAPNDEPVYRLTITKNKTDNDVE